MKTSTISSSVTALLALAACDVDAVEETQVAAAQESADAGSPSRFHSAVGAPIDAATGTRWIDNLRQAAGGEPASYLIEAATLRQALELPGCVGIRLHYGVDESGEPRLFPIAVDGEGRALAGTEVPAEARRSIRRYVGPARYHFFGSDTFHRLLDERGLAFVRATPALDEEGAPQLLLSDAAEIEPRIYEDLSYPGSQDPSDLPEP